MSRKFLTNIDLGNNQLQNALLELVAGNPSSPSDGRIWYDSTNKQVKAQINGVTVNLIDLSAATGNTTSSHISDFTTAVQALKWSSMASPTASVPMNTQKLTGLTAGTSSGDSVEYSQFQTAIANVNAGMTFKLPVIAVQTPTAGNIATLSGLTTVVDGVTLNTAGMRVLLAGQTTGTQNGIWTVGSGAWTQDTSTTNGGDVAPVDQGTLYHDTLWMLTTNGAVTVGTTSQTWAQFGAGNTYGVVTNGGLTQVGNNFEVAAGTGISVGATTAVDFTVVGRKYTNTFTGNGSTTTFAVTHNLNNVAPVWSVYAGTQQYDLEFQPSSANAGSFVAATAPPSATYNYTLIG